MVSHIVTCSLFIWGISALFNDGMLLGKLGDELEKMLPEVLLKPLISCPICMASVWGTTYALYFGLGIGEWIQLCFCVCGLNFVIMEFIRR